MDTVDPTRFVFAFLFVLGLIGILALVLKRYSNSPKFLGRKLFNSKDEGGRIQIVEVRYIDPRRKLVLVKRDQVEHLLLLADGRELVIESGITTHMMDGNEEYAANEP